MKTRRVKGWLIAATTVMSVTGCVLGIMLRKCFLERERVAEESFFERAVCTFEDEGGLILG